MWTLARPRHLQIHLLTFTSSNKMVMQTSQVEEFKKITHKVVALFLSHAQNKHDITNKPVG
jgi:hypothetical protein